MLNLFLNMSMVFVIIMLRMFKVKIVGFVMKFVNVLMVEVKGRLLFRLLFLLFGIWLLNVDVSICGMLMFLGVVFGLIVYFVIVLILVMVRIVSVVMRKWVFCFFIFVFWVLRLFIWVKILVFVVFIWIFVGLVCVWVGGLVWFEDCYVLW